MIRRSALALAFAVTLSHAAGAQLLPDDAARIDQLSDVAAQSLRIAQAELLTALTVQGLNPQIVHTLAERIHNGDQLRDTIITLTQLYGLLSITVVQAPAAAAIPPAETQLDQLGANAADAIRSAALAILEVLTIRGLPAATAELLAERINTNATLREKLLTLMQLQRLLQPAAALLPIPPELVAR